MPQPNTRLSLDSHDCFARNLTAESPSFPLDHGREADDFDSAPLAYVWNLWLSGAARFLAGYDDSAVYLGHGDHERIRLVLRTLASPLGEVLTDLPDDRHD